MEFFSITSWQCISRKSKGVLFLESSYRYVSGFPPIREIRGNFEDISSEGNQGKIRGFQPKSGKKFSNKGTFFKTVFKPFNMRKNVF